MPEVTTIGFTEEEIKALGKLVLMAVEMRLQTLLSKGEFDAFYNVCKKFDMAENGFVELDIRGENLQ